MPDAHKNLAYSLVATAPSPTTTGTSLVVTAGEGARFPTPPFNATISAVGVRPNPTNSETVRVTAISTDTLTIARAQENSSARSVLVGDQIAVSLTAQSLTDIENMASGYRKDEPLIVKDGDLCDIKNGDLIWTDASPPAPNLLINVNRPKTNVQAIPGSIIYFKEDPFIIDAGILVDLTGDPDTVLWTDAQSCPTRINGLLDIGV